MRQIVKTSTCKRYHLEKDGTLKHLGTFSYKFIDEIPPVDRTRVFAMNEEMLAAANSKRMAMERDFERFVDAACEIGGEV